MKKSLFGTSGIRGDAEKLFTSQFCFDIGRTFVEFLKQRKFSGPLAVGMDPRTSSPQIKEKLLVGLATAGEELYDEGVTPIPSINWLIKSTPIEAAVMITGSHIAPKLNGLKFYAHEEEVSTEDQVEIENLYYKFKEKQKVSKISPEVHLESRARELYNEMLFNLVTSQLPKWKVGLDCANGSQSVVMPALLQRLGLEVLEINCDPQKDFIARDTDTDDKAGIEELKETVRSQKCDFGIAFDGDGDRVVFVDESGQFVPGEYSCSLIAKALPDKTIVTTVASSQVVETLGKSVIRTPVGSPHVVGAMKKHGAKFGFEQNGGAVFGEVMYTRDGGNVAMHMINLLAEFKEPFSRLIGQLPKFYMRRTKVDYKWELKDKIIKKAKEHFKGIKTEEIDGLKIWLDATTWILFRSSANAPEFRVFAESKNESQAEKLLEEGIDLVNNIIAEES